LKKEINEIGNGAKSGLGLRSAEDSFTCVMSNSLGYLLVSLVQFLLWN